MGIFLGNGGVKNVKEIYVGVDGTPRKVKEGYVGVGGVPKLFFKSAKPGDRWVITEDGSWTVPAAGYYRIEIHGGGGGGAGVYKRNSLYVLGGGSGGGSGELYQNQFLNAGDIKNIVVGKGGSGGPGNSGYSDDFENYGEDGGTTTFGELTVYGGRAGVFADAGYGYGSLASDGEAGNYYEGTIGGSGGAAAGDYGNGGNGGDANQSDGSSGTDGGVIIDYIGDSPKKDPELKFGTEDIRIYTSDPKLTGSTAVTWLGDGELHISFKYETNDFTARVEGNTIYVTASYQTPNSAILVVSVDETDEYIAAKAEISVFMRADV